MLELWDEFANQLRNFFKNKGYIEVSTPILLKSPNLDANVEPIPVDVSIRGTTKRMWLQTSPEYSMKKLLSKYQRSIFQIAKVFRNNELGKLHRPEFHMLEWYRVGADYTYLIEEIKELLSELFKVKEFRKVSVSELFSDKLGFTPSQDTGKLKAQLSEAGIHFEEGEDWETLFYRAFVEVERSIGWDAPTFITDFPEKLCALAKVKEGRAMRFELFIKGIELANGWSEETDPLEVRRRLEEEAQRRGLPLDEEFIEAHTDMPECAGCSIGVDRLFMLWLGKDSLEDIELYGYEEL